MIMTAIVDYLISQGFPTVWENGIPSVVVPARRSISQWIWRSPKCRIFRLYIHDYDLLLVPADSLIGMDEHCLNLTDPEVLDHLVKILQNQRSPDEEIQKEWKEIRFEAHHPKCTCSYCSESVWPILKLPKCKKPNSWRRIAFWIFGRRVYIRWTLSRWRRSK